MAGGSPGRYWRRQTSRMPTSLPGAPAASHSEMLWLVSRSALRAHAMLGRPFARANRLAEHQRAGDVTVAAGRKPGEAVEQVAERRGVDGLLAGVVGAGQPTQQSPLSRVCWS
jgi:hypothetical protein